MTIRKNCSRPRAAKVIGDIERPHPLVVDEFGGEISSEPLPMRLSDVWSDFLRLAGEPDAAAPVRKASIVPLLDDMKGILQWD